MSVSVSLLHKYSASQIPGTDPLGDISTAGVSERQETHVVMVFMERFMLFMMHVSIVPVHVYTCISSTEARGRLKYTSQQLHVFSLAIRIRPVFH